MIYWFYFHRIVKKDLTEKVILGQSPERNGKVNPSNVWGELLRAAASVNTLRVFDIFKEKLAAR